MKEINGNSESYHKTNEIERSVGNIEQDVLIHLNYAIEDHKNGSPISAMQHYEAASDLAIESNGKIEIWPIVEHMAVFSSYLSLDDRMTVADIAVDKAYQGGGNTYVRSAVYKVAEMGQNLHNSVKKKVVNWGNEVLKAYDCNIECDNLEQVIGYHKEPNRFAIK